MNKKKLAIRMQTRMERLTRGGWGAPFGSKAWVARSDSRLKKELSKRK